MPRIRVLQKVGPARPCLMATPRTATPVLRTTTRKGQATPTSRSLARRPRPNYPYAPGNYARPFVRPRLGQVLTLWPGRNRTSSRRPSRSERPPGRANFLAFLVGLSTTLSLSEWRLRHTNRDGMAAWHEATASRVVDGSSAYTLDMVT